MATKAICGLRQVGFGIDAASSERLRHRNGGKLDEGCNGDRGLRYLSLTTVSNRDCKGAKAPQKYPKRCSDTGIEKSWAKDALEGLGYRSPTTVSHLQMGEG